MAQFPKRSRAQDPWKQGAQRTAPSKSKARTAWDKQAKWYDERHGDAGDDFHHELVLPAVERHLNLQTGQSVLDLCCGTGLLGRFLHDKRISYTGLDASEQMLGLAQERSGEHEQYILGSVHKIDDAVGHQRYDAITVVLGLQDLDPLAPVFRGIRRHLHPGGRLVVVLTHPCFRVPKHSDWGWDERRQIQYRRLDGYNIPKRLPILTNPGMGAASAQSYSYHRPLSAYINALGAAGLPVVASEELCSHRRGSKGRKSEAEDLAAREFPVFLLLRSIPVGE